MLKSLFCRDRVLPGSCTKTQSFCRQLVIWILLIACLYLAIVLLFAVQQDRFVFAAAGHGDRGVPADIEGLKVSELRRADGGRFRIVTVPAVLPRAIGLWFTGNKEDLFAAANTGRELARYGLTMIGSEHPGYGSSEGPPTVDSFMAEAAAAAAYARSVADASQLPLVIFGNSVGTFCAVHAASLGFADRLVLRAPPTTMLAAGKSRFGWLPVALLLRHRFDSLAKAKDVRCPTLVLHGDCDQIVPQRLGRQLASAFAGPTQFVDCHRYGHNDLPLAPEGPYGECIRAFLSAR
jgi:hypothetical protein